MRLIVKKDNEVLNELKFGRGPVNIGRHAESEIFLPERKVSRHHAVIYNTNGGDWIVEDLDSVNKTYLNNQEVHKSKLSNGDEVRICNFKIEVELEGDSGKEEPINLEDTLEESKTGLGTKAQESRGAKTVSGEVNIQRIVRKLYSARGPDIKISARKIKDFAEATEAICRSHGIDEILETLLTLTAKQFNPYHRWIALRAEASGPMLAYKGKYRDGTKFDIDELEFKDEIMKAAEKRRFVLFPRIPDTKLGGSKSKRLHSVMIAPVASETGCFGVIYVDNDMSHEAYSLSDLDYLMLLAMHTGVVVENF